MGSPARGRGIGRGGRVTESARVWGQMLGQLGNWEQKGRKMGRAGMAAWGAQR